MSDYLRLGQTEDSLDLETDIEITSPVEKLFFTGSDKAALLRVSKSVMLWLSIEVEKSIASLLGLAGCLVVDNQTGMLLLEKLEGFFFSFAGLLIN